MKRGTLKGISDIMREMCRQEGLETPLNEYRLIKAWSKVLGSGVQAYTKDLFIKNQVLYVVVTSAVLRQELMMNRRSLVQRLNGAVGAQVITNIIFR